jgi:chromosome segregation ATPase
VYYLSEVLLSIVAVSIALTVGAAIEYYRQLRSVQKEYEKAKEAVEDIVLSFNRQLKRESEKLETMAYRIEAISSKYDRTLKSAEEVEKQFYVLQRRIGRLIDERKEILARLEEIDRRIRDVSTSHRTLDAKIARIKMQDQQFPAARPPRIKGVIPIRREKALAPLTQTELSVLEILALEGPKSGPEIRNRIRLSREHTARLMKKLYEAGYLERNTRKIPFQYDVKEEMESLLKNMERKT